jgi:hypothetical protein
MISGITRLILRCHPDPVSFVDPAMHIEKRPISLAKATIDRDF